MTVRQIQWGIASVFFILGGWALVAPRSVIELTLLPEYRVGTPILPFAVACFGAQAMISGLFAAFSIFTRATFLAYGIALLPFFAFNWWFTFVDPVFTWVGLADAVGNVVMLALCVMGWRRAEAEQPARRSGSGLTPRLMPARSMRSPSPRSSNIAASTTIGRR